MHTDRGSQYVADRYLHILHHHGITPRRSRKGHCWDNAVAESFFHILKTACIYLETFDTREQAQDVIFDDIEVFYNRRRRHSANGNLAPMVYEETQKAITNQFDERDGFCRKSCCLVLLEPSVLAQERHHSKPGAAYVMFLDFNGFIQEEYEEGTECNGSPSHVFALNIPVFDLDGVPATFNQAENDAIFEIWERVAEDFIPFDIDVTTEEPPGLVPDIGVGVRIVTGGDNGDPVSFRTYDVRGVSSARENTALIPQDYHGLRTARSIAQTVSHEAGHLFAWWTGLFDFRLGMSHYTSAESYDKKLQVLTSAQGPAKPEASTELLWPVVPAGAYLLRVTGKDSIVDLDLALQPLSKK